MPLALINASSASENISSIFAPRYWCGVLLRDRIVEIGIGVINEICRNCTLGNLLLPISTFGSLMFPFLVPGNFEKARKGAFSCSYVDHLLPIAANI